MMIRVLLADDSTLARAVVKDALERSDDVTVVGEAQDGQEAVDMTRLLSPDLVIIDLVMPVMDGLTAIETIMAETPTPILVLSATVDQREVSNAFVAIKRGALDVMEKPGEMALENDGFAALLLEKVRLLARIKVIRRWSRGKVKPAAPPHPTTGGRKLILAIGASTGGPKAVMRIVRTLPADLPATVFIVQHIASGFAKGFTHWLASECRLPVRLARDGDFYAPGEVLVAPNDCHMIIDQQRIRLIDEAPVNCCRPSIDVFFNSVAAERGGQTVGVLLTGMGRDGALGLLAIREKGGVTLAQDEETCAVFGMPKAAIAMNAADHVLPLDAIPVALERLFSRAPSSPAPGEERQCSNDT